MGLNRHYIKRGIGYLKRNGIVRTLNKAVERLSRDRDEKDYRHVSLDEAAVRSQREHVFAHPYKFSILVPVYETDPVLFRQMLDSVGEQTYGNWELILADASSDESRRGIVRDFMEEYTLICKDSFGTVFDKVKYVRISQNLGISGNSNEALAHAGGDYIGLLDHDDLLENSALFDIMSAIEKSEQTGIESESITRIMAVYTDEDKISEDGRSYFDPNIKPDFDPVLLCTNNYICHFFVADTNLAKSVGGFRPGYDGAQDHDLILRCTEGLRREQILHVPSVLYHWRSTKGSTSENPDSKLYAYKAGRAAVSDFLKRTGIDAKVTDSPHLGFFDLEYGKMGGDVVNITTEDFDSMKRPGYELFGRQFVMILSPSLEEVSDDSIGKMVSCMAWPHVGAVTGKIIGADGKVESAGYDTDDDGGLKPRFSGLNRRFSGYMHRADLDQTVGGFTNDCVLIRKEAVKEWSPRIKLKDRYSVYYMPKAEFRRKAK